MDTIEYTENIYGKRIVDNSCGSGNILVEIVKRFIADAKRQKKRKATIKKGLESCIYGYDIDPKMVNLCIENLNKVAINAGLTDVQWNIFNEDGLYIDDNTFDYVVGNPPYIAYLNLDVKTRVNTKDNFCSCKLGKFDYSYAFIEKGLNLLKDNGKMVMITPANMFKTVFAESLRRIIKPKLTHIIDCSAKKVFDNVLTTTAITVYEKNCESNVLIYTELSDDNKPERIIPKEALVEKWNFTDFVDEGERRFGDFYKASNCIATLANKVFILTVNQQGDLDVSIEPEALRVAKSPKSEQFGMQQKIIFPYHYKDGELQRYSEEELSEKFPKLMIYLNSKKKELEKRDSDKNAKWYEYGRSQALRHLNQEKLLISTIITKTVKVYELDADAIPYSGIYITSLNGDSLNDARLILQTNRFYNYLLTKGVKVSGDSIRISSKDLEDYRY